MRSYHLEYPVEEAWPLYNGERLRVWADQVFLEVWSLFDQDRLDPVFQALRL